MIVKPWLNCLWELEKTWLYGNMRVESQFQNALEFVFNYKRVDSDGSKTRNGVDQLYRAVW